MKFGMSHGYTLGRFVFDFHKIQMGNDVIMTSFKFSLNNWIAGLLVILYLYMLIFLFYCLFCRLYECTSNSSPINPMRLSGYHSATLYNKLEILSGYYNDTVDYLEQCLGVNQDI